MQKRNFNLLKPLTPPATAWDRVYDWLIGKARIVVLITELIVASTFVFKVIVDTTAKNKDREIARLTQELNFYAQDLEPKFRQLQAKSDSYVLVWNEAKEYSNSIQEIFSYIQNESSEIVVTIKGDQVSVLGYEDLADIKVLETALKSSKSFTQVTVSDLSLSEKEVLQNKGSYILVAKIVDTKRDQI